MKLLTPQNGEVFFSEQIPSELARFKVNRTIVHAARGGYGALLLQGLPPGEIKAWHSVFRIARDTSFFVQSPTNGHGVMAKLRLLIKTSQLMNVKGYGDIYIQEGHANMLYAPDNQFTHYYKKGKEYISLDIFYPLNQLVKWRTLFPDLDQFVAKIEANKPGLLSNKPMYLSAGVFSIVHEMIHSRYDDPYHKLFFDNKASLMLFLLLMQTLEPEEEQSFQENRHINSILHAKSIITSNEQYHFNISQIAKEVGLNEVKLKKGFKQIFGTGLYGFLMLARIQKAKELLELTTKSVTEISHLIGYKSTSSFIKIFKNRFGHSPFAWRRVQKAKINGGAGSL
jgi:AraC family transcriptional regulator, transcriptional activator of the genes for pyochelin and ferripyochelin receptors